jgi:hypothetical protein
MLLRWYAPQSLFLSALKIAFIIQGKVVVSYVSLRHVACSSKPVPAFHCSPTCYRLIRRDWRLTPSCISHISLVLIEWIHYEYTEYNDSSLIRDLHDACKLAAYLLFQMFHLLVTLYIHTYKKTNPVFFSPQAIYID